MGRERRESIKKLGKISPLTSLQEGPPTGLRRCPEISRYAKAIPQHSGMPVRRFLCPIKDRKAGLSRSRKAPVTFRSGRAISQEPHPLTAPRAPRAPRASRDLSGGLSWSWMGLGGVKESRTYGRKNRHRSGICALGEGDRFGRAPRGRSGQMPGMRQFLTLALELPGSITESGA